MAKVKGLKCRECGRPYPAEPLHVCEFCFGPLEVDYDYSRMQKVVNRKRIEAGPYSVWRYRDWLPIEEENPIGSHCGMTPPAPREEPRRGLTGQGGLHQKRRGLPPVPFIQGPSCGGRGD